MNINEIIDRMAEIKVQTDSLDDEYTSLQAQLLVEAEKALTDTKNKSVILILNHMHEIIQSL